MRNKILGLFAALVSVMALTFSLGASPASAISGNTWCVEHGGNHGPTGGFQGYDTNTCLELHWRIQNDGTGIKVEDAWTDVTMGCGDLENFPALKNQSFNPNDPQDVTWVGVTRGMADVDCHAYYDFEVVGPDNGPMGFRWKAEVNVNNGSNFCIQVSAILRTDGTTDLQSKGTTPC